MMTPTPFALVLASASPRRRKILEQMGLRFEVVVPDVDEVHWDTAPADTVRENAILKARAVAVNFPEAAVLAADTVVSFKGISIGKPETVSGAMDMLRQFSGCQQLVYTGMALLQPEADMLCAVTEASVQFGELSDAVIAQYVELVNPLDKAGGYDIDQHSDLIISGYTGSWTNIMGLPQDVIEAWLQCK
jgi:septum formation protein